MYKKPINIGAGIFLSAITAGFILTGCEIISTELNAGLDSFSGDSETLKVERFFYEKKSNLFVVITGNYIYDANIIDSYPIGKAYKVGNPSYPISLSKGYIDLDGEGYPNSYDEKFNINMSTSKGSVVSPITTLLNRGFQEEVLRIATGYEGSFYKDYVKKKDGDLTKIALAILQILKENKIDNLKNAIIDNGNINSVDSFLSAVLYTLEDDNSKDVIRKLIDYTYNDFMKPGTIELAISKYRAFEKIDHKKIYDTNDYNYIYDFVKRDNDIILSGFKDKTFSELDISKYVKGNDNISVNYSNKEGKAIIPMLNYSYDKYDSINYYTGREKTYKYIVLKTGFGKLYFPEGSSYLGVKFVEYTEEFEKNGKFNNSDVLLNVEIKYE
jgi:hypothetical protein